METVPFEEFIELVREQHEKELAEKKTERRKNNQDLPAPSYSRSQVRLLFRKCNDLKMRTDVMESRMSTFETECNLIEERCREVEEMGEELKDLFMVAYAKTSQVL